MPSPVYIDLTTVPGENDIVESIERTASPPASLKRKRDSPPGSRDDSPSERPHRAKKLDSIPAARSAGQVINRSNAGPVAENGTENRPGLLLRWHQDDFLDLADELREQFNPEPFARASGKPVEEVRFIISQLACKALCRAGEVAKERKRKAEEDELRRVLREIAHPTCKKLTKSARIEKKAASKPGDLQARFEALRSSNRR